MVAPSAEALRASVGRNQYAHEGEPGVLVDSSESDVRPGMFQACDVIDT